MITFFPYYPIELQNNQTHYLLQMMDSANEKTAESLLNPSSKSRVIVKNSKIPGAGKGLFVKKQISSKQPVVIYYGEKRDTEVLYDLYESDPEQYQELSTIIRGTPNGFAIIGEKTDNPNFHGVYVNDISCLNCNAQTVTRDELEDYAKTAQKCNLMTVDTSDFPVYVSTRKIKKGEELYAHYGIGYWLLHNGCSPEEVAIMNQIYQFENLY